MRSRGRQKRVEVAGEMCSGTRGTPAGPVELVRPLPVRNLAALGADVGWLTDKFGIDWMINIDKA